jgi:hypothetical protein
MQLFPGFEQLTGTHSLDHLFDPHVPLEYFVPFKDMFDLDIHKQFQASCTFL